MPATSTLPRRVPKTELVQVRVDSETKRRVRLLANIDLLDDSDVVRQALAAYLNKRLAALGTS